MLEQKLQEELNRYKAINKYGKKLIMEQDVPPAPEAPAEDPAATAPLDAPAPTDAPADSPLGGDAPAPDLGGGGDLPAPDAGAAPDLGGGGEAPLTDAPAADTTEELDITDLVDMTQSIKKDIEANKNDHGTVLQKMDDVFSKLDDLESKLGEMNQLVAKIDELGAKVQEMKPKSEVEKLEMRSLDSYPFNQKPQEFFAQKQGEMRASGKNEYVLTKDEVDNYPTEEIKSSFNPDVEEDEFKF